ncbi:MAG TPA: FtsL-like putative cell division protein [Panacibacter sp.]|nr:FtsL-like putative cell division protein [Panacibacter sp.]
MSDTTGDAIKNKKLVPKKMKEKKQHTEKNKGLFAKLIGHEWILKNLVFFLFLALLAVIYIGNGHAADNTIRDINNTAKEVKELQYEYKSLKSEEMFKSREAQIVQAATPLGLKISNDQPMRLKIDMPDGTKQGQ